MFVVVTHSHVQFKKKNNISRNMIWLESLSHDSHFNSYFFKCCSFLYVNTCIINTNTCFIVYLIILLKYPIKTA